MIRGAKGLASAVLTLLVASAILFFIGSRSTGGAISGMALGRFLHTSDIEAWRASVGIDLPWWKQWLSFWGNALSGDFGRSWVDQRPVLEIIGEALIPSLLLSGSALLLSYVIGVPWGTAIAIHPHRKSSRLSQRLLAAAYPVPAFIIAMVAVMFIGYFEWNIIPLRGWRDLSAQGLERVFSTFTHLALPVGCLVFSSLGRVTMLQEEATRQVLGQPWVVAVRSRGVSWVRLLTHHLPRASLRPVVSMLGVDLPRLIAGSILIERIFSIRGLGFVTYESVLRRDFPVIMGVCSLALLTTVCAMRLSDRLLVRLDPRQSRRASGDTP